MRSPRAPQSLDCLAERHLRSGIGNSLARLFRTLTRNRLPNATRSRPECLKTDDAMDLRDGV
jgi:hypothetical protein